MLQSVVYYAKTTFIYFNNLRQYILKGTRNSVTTLIFPNEKAAFEIGDTQSPDINILV